MSIKILLAIALTWTSLLPFGQENGKDLEGTWDIEAAELGGQKLDALKGAKLKLAKGKYEFQNDKGEYKLSVAEKHNALDVIGQEGPNYGKTFPAIYELKGDTLRICYDLSGAKRPTAFESVAGTKLYLVTYRRKQDDNRLAHEGVVNAPLDQVWAAFATKEGMESWMAAHAEIDVKLGGKMKTQYDPKGTVDDAKSIENTILSYEPMRMLSFKVSRAPQSFPFPNAIKNMWTVIYFEAQGEKATRVKVVSMGFGNDDESKKMREFFDRGNAFTLKQLQERFAPKTGAK